MNLSSIIVTYNGDTWIEKCIDSLKKSKLSGFNHSIIVFDNKSLDNTVSIIDNKYPEVILIKSNDNLGFGKANNEGIKIALSKKADYIFLLNQDAMVQVNTIAQLIEIAEANSQFGILSPVQLAANGEWDSQFSSYYKKSKEFTNNLRECNFVNAAGWLITSKCLTHVGGFSPLFAHYGEDVDYCNRVKYFNFKIGIVTHTSFIHDRIQKLHMEIPLQKQIQQVHINQLAKLTNINYNLFSLIVSQYLNLLKKTFNPKAGANHINKKAFFKGIISSQKKIEEIIQYRKKYKLKEEFLFLKKG